MLNLIDAEGDCLKLLAWSTNLSALAGSTDPSSDRECWAVAGPCRQGACQGWRGRRNAMARGGGKSSPAAQLSQNNPPCTSNSTLQMLLLTKIPETLSSCSSQLSWERQIRAALLARGVQIAQPWAILEKFKTDETPPLQKNCKASSVWHTFRNTMDIYPQHDIPDRQEYLWTETTPSSFNNRKKYSDVDKSTHPVKFFFPLGLFFPLGSFFSPRCCCFLN